MARSLRPATSFRSRSAPRFRSEDRLGTRGRPSREYDPSDGHAAPARSTFCAAPAACPRRLSRRVARLAPSAARLLARPAIWRRWRRLVWTVELVGRRLVGQLVCRSGLARDRGLLPAPEPWPAELATGRCAVAFIAHPARALPAGSPQPRLVALSRSEVLHTFT